MCFESVFNIHHDWRLLKEFPKNGEDGQPARVLFASMPAKFYRVEALASTNSVGGPVRPFSLQTGSGDEMQELACRIGQAVADGMLGVGD